MTALSEMYSSMPTSLAYQAKSVSQQQLGHPKEQQNSMDKESVPTAASFFLRYADLSPCFPS